MPLNAAKITNMLISAVSVWKKNTPPYQHLIIDPATPSSVFSFLHREAEIY